MPQTSNLVAIPYISTKLYPCPSVTKSVILSEFETVRKGVTGYVFECVSSQFGVPVNTH